MVPFPLSVILRKLVSTRSLRSSANSTSHFAVLIQLCSMWHQCPLVPPLCFSFLTLQLLLFSILFPSAHLPTTGSQTSKWYMALS